MKIATLYEQVKTGKGLLTPELIELYGGNLYFPETTPRRPYVLGNFVETIDGIVSYGIPSKSSGGPISGGNEEDHFVMGLLRTLADAVLIGSGTLREDPGRVRIPEFIYPQEKAIYDKLRKKLGKNRLPINVVLTASGKIDLEEPTFHTDGLQVVIITTKEGAARITSEHGDVSPVAVRSTGESGKTTPKAVLDILSIEFGVRLLLHEGGPTIFGEFLAVNTIDELFLTLAPQIAGRKTGLKRPSLAGESVFLPETAPWFTLQSVKRGSSGHLFLRYALSKKAD